MASTAAGTPLSKHAKKEQDGEPKSVTLISHQSLPTYSCERFFMLAELEMNAHSTQFLSYLSEDSSTQETDEVSCDESQSGEGHQRHTGSYNRTVPMAPFIMLYILWRPTMTPNPQEFCETIILDFVSQLESIVELTNSLEASVTRRSSPRSKNDEEKGSNTQADSEGTTSKASVYLVIDKVVLEPTDLEFDASNPLTDPREAFYQRQTSLAEELARKVAAHPKLRHVCEGITVSLSNHERAAPGLEICYEAACIGQKDRRVHDAGSKSLVGILTNTSNDLLGLNPDEADAAQGVWQRRVCAEWNGQGNLSSFARRAHQLWRIQRGLPHMPDPVQLRKIPRRIRLFPREKVDEEDPELDRRVALRIKNAFGAIVIFVYVFFHFRPEITGMLRFFDPELWNELAQLLRQF